MQCFELNCLFCLFFGKLITVKTKVFGGGERVCNHKYAKANKKNNCIKINSPFYSDESLLALRCITPPTVTKQECKGTLYEMLDYLRVMSIIDITSTLLFF